MLCIGNIPLNGEVLWMEQESYLACEKGILEKGGLLLS
jgi:hypothetical protein